MPNVLDSNGLQVASLSEIIAALVAGMQTIFGVDINVEQNSPDGQLINIFAQVAADQLELLVQAYNTFSVETAFGVALDQRVALNGVTRIAGTFTQANVLITVNRALTLNGLDNPSLPPFTVADDTGNQFALVTTHVFGGAGSATLVFQAVAIGAVETVPNTITNQVTTVLGVTAVNNPTTASDVIGINEETDAQLKIRRGKMFYLAANGPSAAIAAALLAIPDVTDAFVVENATNATVNGVPANSIWAIVTGGTAAEIGQAIYSKKAPGCGMKGTQTFNVARPNAQIFQAKWDASISQPLYIKFGITPRNPSTSFDHTQLANELAAALIYKLGQNPNIGDVVGAMLQIAPQGYLTAVGVSTDGISYFDTVSPTDAQHYFNLIAANITIT